MNQPERRDMYSWRPARKNTFDKPAWDTLASGLLLSLSFSLCIFVAAEYYLRPRTRTSTFERAILRREYHPLYFLVVVLILLHEEFLQFDWLSAVVFQLNLKYLHVKITNHVWVVV